VVAYQYQMLHPIANYLIPLLDFRQLVVHLVHPIGRGRGEAFGGLATVNSVWPSS
jgi:hypothetical protein